MAPHLVHEGGHGAVKPEMAGVERILMSADLYEIDRHILRLQQLLDLQKGLLPAVVFHKIVAAAAGIGGHACMRKSHNAVGDALQRAVAAAGIKPHGIAVLLTIFAHERRRILRGFRAVNDTVLHAAKCPRRSGGTLCVAASGMVIDHKYMFDGYHPLQKSAFFDIHYSILPQTKAACQGLSRPLASCENM